MINHGITRSTVYPFDVDIKETKVFTAEDVRETEVTEENDTHTEYEYSLKEYDKDEYIKLMDESNKELEEQLTDAQLALCELYELMEV